MDRDWAFVYELDDPRFVYKNDDEIGFLKSDRYYPFYEIKCADNKIELVMNNAIEPVVKLWFDTLNSLITILKSDLAYYAFDKFTSRILVDDSEMVKLLLVSKCLS